jgi:hypothetical protein
MYEIVAGEILIAAAEDGHGLSRNAFTKRATQRVNGHPGETSWIALAGLCCCDDLCGKRACEGIYMV